MSTWRRALPLISWVVALVAGLVLFHAAGRGAMAPPPLTDPGSWGAWLSARDPAVAAAAVLRLVVLALAWYLVGVTTVGVVARLLRAARVVRVADALTAPMVRRLLQGALGVGLATAMVGASTAPVPRADAPPAMSVSAQADHEPSAGVGPGVGGEVDDQATLVRVVGADEVGGLAAGDGAEDGAGVDVPVAMRQVDEDGVDPDVPVSMRLLAEESGEPVGDDDVVLRIVPADTTASGESASDAEAEGAPATHRVQSGESLWSIAQDALVDALDREPTDAEVLSYWRQVVEHNRDALADPDNPDLIFPGDEVALVPVPDPDHD